MGIDRQRASSRVDPLKLTRGGVPPTVLLTAPAWGGPIHPFKEAQGGPEDRVTIRHAQVRLWTRQEYERMAAEGFFAPAERVELIEGQIIAMTLQASPHATAVTLAQIALQRVFARGYTVRVQMPLTGC